MSQPENDPSANTQAFKAWADQQISPPAGPTSSRTPLIIIGAVVVVVVLAVLALLIF